MRVAIYARVSTDDQTCAQQLTALREYVAARGWDAATEYIDTISGSKDSRPSLNRLMAAARRRAVDVIVCWKLDRWGRSLQHLVASIQDLTSLGVRFIVPTQAIDTDESNPASRLMLHMLAAFAEFERDMIRERTRAGLQRARRAGSQIGRPKLIVDRQRIRDLRAAGVSLGEIAAELGLAKTTVARICAA